MCAMWRVRCCLKAVNVLFSFRILAASWLSDGLGQLHGMSENELASGAAAVLVLEAGAEASWSWSVSMFCRVQRCTVCHYNHIVGIGRCGKQLCCCCTAQSLVDHERHDTSPPTALLPIIISYQILLPVILLPFLPITPTKHPPTHHLATIPANYSCPMSLACFSVAVGIAVHFVGISVWCAYSKCMQHCALHLHLSG